MYSVSAKGVVERIINVRYYIIIIIIIIILKITVKSTIFTSYES